jgi:hypothetical protein
LLQERKQDGDDLDEDALAREAWSKIVDQRKKQDLPSADYFRLEPSLKAMLRNIVKDTSCPNAITRHLLSNLQRCCNKMCFRPKSSKALFNFMAESGVSHCSYLGACLTQNQTLSFRSLERDDFIGLKGECDSEKERFDAPFKDWVRAQLKSRRREQAILVQLPSRQIKDLEDLQSFAVVDTKCALCLTEFAVRDYICVFPCKHIFHDQESCDVKAWVREHETCPVCRTQLLPQGNDHSQS